jgi:hypothetical protein
MVPKMIPAIVMIWWFLFGAATAEAQMCFRAKPAPRCRTFWVTELGLGYRVGEGRWEDAGWPVSEIGLMYNLGSRNAVGVTTYVTYEPKYSDFRGGFKLRFRRWFNPDLSVNLSGGLLLVGGGYREKHPGFSAHVDLDYKEVLAPYVGLDVLRDATSTLDGSNWHVGVRFGSYPGSGLSGIALVTIAVILYTIQVAG